MKINEILSEAALSPRLTKVFTKEDALSFAINNCSQAVNNYIQNNRAIYRGFGSLDTDNFYLIDPSVGERVSQNATNHYTLLMDNSPYWKNYPKRNKSLVGSTSVYTASGFGDTFIVLPVDNTQIGVCPEYDLWGTTIRDKDLRITSWVDISWNLEMMGFPDTSLDDMIEYGQTPEAQEVLSRFQKNWGINSELEAKDIVSHLMEIMKPDMNDFTLITPGDHLPIKREVWFSAPCVAVPEWTEKSFFNEIKKQL